MILAEKSTPANGAMGFQFAGRLAGTVQHEMNNAFMLLLGHVERLQQTLGPVAPTPEAERLDLAFVCETVQGFGGTVHAANGVDGGARVEFRLPIVPAAHGV